MPSRLEKWIDKIADACGVLASILFVLMLFNVFYDVVARYWFNEVSIGMQEMEWHLFAAMFLIAVPYTLKKEGHVRVDLIYEGLGVRGKAFINLFGTIVLLIPFALLVGWFGIDFAFQSYDLGEGSGDPGGLTNRWIIKAMIPLSFFILALSGLGMILRSLRELKQGDQS